MRQKKKKTICYGIFNRVYINDYTFLQRYWTDFQSSSTKNWKKKNQKNVPVNSSRTSVLYTKFFFAPICGEKPASLDVFRVVKTKGNVGFIGEKFAPKVYAKPDDR